VKTDKELLKKGKQETVAMLLGELPPLEETQLGKDLIQIGEQRGLEKGLEQAALVLLTARHGSVPPDMEKIIRSLSAHEAERLLEYLSDSRTLEEVGQWLAARQG
jgi:hypothetical protein